MASAPELPFDLLEQIFLRLDDVADLVRASAACAAFRRVVSDGRFLRRFRSLHRRPVLGLLRRSSSIGGLRFHPAEPPRRYALAAGRLSSSFLPADPTEHCWHVHDVRDGRVLLSPAGDAATWSCGCLLSSSCLLVYDPLQCKRVEIPPIPKDIVGRQGHYHRCGYSDVQFKPFLVPAADDGKDDEDDLSFRVMYTVLSRKSSLIEGFVYSSVTGHWRGVESLSDADYIPLRRLSSMVRHYAHGCFYWEDPCEQDMLVLDMKRMKFSVVGLPPETKFELKIVVEVADEEDRIGLLVVCQKQNTLQLYSKAIGGAANDCWQRRHDVVVTLPGKSFVWLFGGAADQGYAVIQGVPQGELDSWLYSAPEMRRKAKAHYFTVDLRTLVVEQLCCVKQFDTEPGFLYASFPPPFAPPRL